MLRDGAPTEVPVDQIVAGDVVRLSAGSTVPGDGRLLTCSGLQVDESALTGESFPAEKRVLRGDGAERSVAVFLGTHVVSGTADAVIVRIGQDTELGHVSRHLQRVRPPTEFDVALQRFGALLVQITLGLVLVIFAVNVGLHRPVLDALLFSVALAVGLVPELLPAITTVTLARGARRMAAKEVVVKRLVAIEDFGAVDVLCSDKTGTLTEGRVRLHGAFGVDGAPSARTLELGWVNAVFESGYANPIDAALRDARAGDPSAWTLVGEVPYDFVRKRLSVVVERDGVRWLVTKGQLHSVLAACARAETGSGAVPLGDVLGGVETLHARLSLEGVRTLGVGVRRLDPAAPIGVASEVELDLVGVLGFADPPKADARAILDDLRSLGISTRIVTGDDRRVAAHVWETLQGKAPVVLTGPELRGLTTEALVARVSGVDVFAEVEPTQKERIVAALRRAGHVVAYLGDGINDAPALHAADVGISVDGAADVAREAADVVLKRPDLAVLAAGVREGRRTHANTLKYVFYTTSANFGNMVSMAVASLFLPFLPLLPKQILLNNLLSDLPALAVAGDAVDEDRLRVPSRLRLPEIRLFMLVFGSISSVFDLTTFAALLKITDAAPALFRTGWFVESLLTELLVLLVLRSHHPLGRSRPSNLVLGLTLGVSALCVALPYTGPVARLFGLVPLPPLVLATILAITSAYLAATEVAKRWFFRRTTRR